jgi:hypothetical protein
MNPTKFVLHFYDFSMIFYAIYKKLGNSLYYFSCTFAAGTWKELWLCNVVPGGGRSVRAARFRRARRRAWPGMGWGGAYGPLGSGLGR